MPAAAAVRRSRRRDGSKTPSIVTARLASSALPEQESTGVTAPAEPTWRRPGAVAILALALPILFLHVDYQPGFSVGFGSTSATVDLSDIAVWLVALTALVVALRDGLAPLRAGRA